MTRRHLPDVEVDALSTAVQHGLAHLREQQPVHSTTSFDLLLKRHADRAVAAIHDGTVEQAVRDLTIGQWIDLAQGLGALSMRPGGFRLFEVVFCAAHFPRGADARTRYACRTCDPGLFRDLTLGVDPRDVIPIEGTVLL